MSRGEYVPLPPPQDPNIPPALSVYLQNELLRLSQGIGAATQRAIGQVSLDTPPANDVVPAATTNTVKQYDTISIEDDIGLDLVTGEVTLLFAGTYAYTFNASVASSANNTTLTFELCVDGTPVPGVGADVFLKTAGEPVSVSFSGLGEVDKGQVATVTVKHNAGAARTLTYTTLRSTVEGSFFV